MKNLSFDPSNNKTDDYEGAIGVATEAKYGYFERDPSGAGDFISMSGPYKDKVFEAIGIPEKAIVYNKNMDSFLKSLQRHIDKSVDYILLDMTHMTSEQKKSVINFLKGKNLMDSERIIKLGE
mgnify:CR=1 FL=1